MYVFRRTISAWGLKSQTAAKFDVLNYLCLFFELYA